MNLFRNGKLWMVFWLIFIFIMFIWSILTKLYWMQSTANINALSLVANIGMGTAGLQAALAMRKADSADKF